jgi:hypothetical protein
MPDLDDSGDRTWPFQLTLAEVSAKPVICRSGVSAERRKSLEIGGSGFLPKAATLFLQRSFLFSDKTADFMAENLHLHMARSYGVFTLMP